MQQAYSMTKCNLSMNGVENEGALALADAIKSTDILKELDITNTRINTEAAVNLAKALAVNETLLVLKVSFQSTFSQQQMRERSSSLMDFSMGKNPMESAGCYGVITQVILNPNSKLQELHFDVTLTNTTSSETRVDQVRFTRYFRTLLSTKTLTSSWSNCTRFTLACKCSLEATKKR